MIKRRKPKKMMQPKESAPIACPGHLQYVRGYECVFEGLVGKTPTGKDTEPHECMGKIAAHHVKSRGAGGGDEQVVPLCTLAHSQQHGGYKYPVDLKALADKLWLMSPHGIKWRRENE